MKRFRLWLRDLSLTQQLLSLIFIVVVTLSLFFFVVVNNNVDTFVKREMFNEIHRSQNSVQFAFDNNVNDYDGLIDDYVTHIFYYKDTNESIFLNPLHLDSKLQNEIGDLFKNDLIIENDYVFRSDTQTYYYSLHNLNDNIVLISIMNVSYQNEFKELLANTVINANMIIVFVLFFVLMIWISSLIHPLSMITAYINHIKNDEEATLSVKRRDEIGEVATALIDMKEQLNKENRIKEEMLQNISHDLKTPIATIKSYSESIKDGIYPYDTLEKSVDVIIEHANRLEKKVYQLILFNKMGYLLDESQAGNNLNMKEVIEKVIVSLKVVRPEININTYLEEVYFHGEEEPWRIVVENLIDNALRYALSTINIILRNEELCIMNDGKQISAERLEKLFRPYEKGTDGKFGLGLSIVKRVTSTYGYLVCAENLTNGVVFRIYPYHKIPNEIPRTVKTYKKAEFDPEIKQIENKSGIS